MPPKRVLISGAGIAGSVLAYWLDRAGISVTVVERAPSLRSTGQAVDIRGAAVDVIRQMGVESAIRSKSTCEEGVAFVDAAGREKAVFMASGSTEQQALTSEFEILRGDLALIFYDLTKDKVNYVFGESVKELRQLNTGVEVMFENVTATASFDVVVAADGLGSRLRSMVSSATTAKECFKSLGQYVAYFTIEEDLLNGGKIAKWYNAPGGRLILVRPNMKGQTGAFLGVVTESLEAKDASTAGAEAQKTYLRRLFHDAGWLNERVLDGMDRADDFYYQAVAQIKMEKWSEGGVVFLGDACYCPSPISGMGTSLAIVGAYVLAGELVMHQNDLPSAFQSYQERLTPYVAQCQKLIPGAPAIANPQTQMGITVLASVLGFVSWSGLDRLVSRIAAIPAFSREGFALPQYEWPS
ncbi:hypothetical protein MMC20_001973 [Loxospora ochrophaea]|nr:hypothetical protein [Loxospora ochrophaea]